MDSLLARLSASLAPAETERLLTFASTVAAGAVAWMVYKMLHPPKLAVHNLPGPSSPGWLLGNLDQWATAEAGDFLDDLSTKHGPTVVFADLFGRTRVASIDPSFVNHVLRNSTAYQRDDRTSRLFQVYAPGRGVLLSEGDAHRRQRRVIQPVFNHPTLAQLHPTFLDKAYELRDRLLETIAKASPAKAGENRQAAEVDIDNWASRLTLDIIGLTAFDYRFNALQSSDNELYVAIHDAFDVSDSGTPWVMLQALFPIFRQLRTPSGRVLMHVGEDIVKTKKAAVLETAKIEGKGQVDREAVVGNNLIAKIVRANLAADVPASQRLTDKEVADQVGVFLFTGFVTTATALAWMLHALAEKPASQIELRDELLSVSDDRPSGPALDELPYLDAVSRETLRLYCPVTDVTKVATKDVDVIPLSTPVHERDGIPMSELIVEKGVEVVVPIVNINRSKAIWGKDAHESRPERWLRESPIPDAAKSYDSAWGNLLTFSAGPRSCLGSRFAIEELKVAAFVLVRSLTFAPVEPKVSIHRFSQFIQTPKVKGGLQEGDKLPLVVAPYRA